MIGIVKFGSHSKFTMLTLILSMPHCCNIVCKHSYPRLFRKSDNLTESMSVSPPLLRKETINNKYRKKGLRQMPWFSSYGSCCGLLMWALPTKIISISPSLFLPGWHSKYAVLHFCFPTGEYVAQFKFTLLLMPNGPIRYSLKCFTLQLCHVENTITINSSSSYVTEKLFHNV